MTRLVSGHFGFVKRSDVFAFSNAKTMRARAGGRYERSVRNNLMLFRKTH